MSEEKMKQGLPCAVVQDLLPLYVEGLTQEETNAVMDAHLSQCVSCSRALGAQQAQFGADKAKSENDQRVVRFLKSIVYKRVLTVALIVVAALVLLFGAASWLNRTEMVPTEDIAIAGKYLMPDGRIMLAVQAKGLNQRNVHYLNSLEVSLSVEYSSVYAGEAEGMDIGRMLYQLDPYNISVNLQGSVTLRRNLWYSWFFPADQRGDNLYLLVDLSKSLEVLSGFEKMMVMDYDDDEQIDSVYINGYKAWSKTDELRRVTDDEAALLLAAWEAQEMSEQKQEAPRKDVPDALDALLDAAGRPASSPIREADPSRITSTPSPSLTLPLPPRK